MVFVPRLVSYMMLLLASLLVTGGKAVKLTYNDNNAIQELKSRS